MLSHGKNQIVSNVKILEFHTAIYQSLLRIEEKRNMHRNRSIKAKLKGIFFKFIIFLCMFLFLEILSFSPLETSLRRELCSKMPAKLDFQTATSRVSFLVYFQHSWLRDLKTALPPAPVKILIYMHTYMYINHLRLFGCDGSCVHDT